MAISNRLTGPWVIALASALAVLLTANLGFWQLRRADEKVTIQTKLEERLAMAPVTEQEIQTAQATRNWEPLHHRRVTLKGKWMDRGTVFLNNRPMSGQTGFFVVTPMALKDGALVVLIQRGWVPRDPVNRERLPDLPTSRDVVEVEGRFAPQPSRMYELGQDEAGRIRQNLSASELSEELGVRIEPVSVLQLTPEGQDASQLQDGLMRQWPMSFPDVHKHYGYAFQWFGLSGLVVVLYVWFQIISPRRRSNHA